MVIVIKKRQPLSISSNITMVLLYMCGKIGFHLDFGNPKQTGIRRRQAQTGMSEAVAPNSIATLQTTLNSSLKKID